jgi:competence protein ComEC
MNFIFQQKVLFILLIFFIFTAGILEKGYRWNLRMAPLEVSFLNVGQGDAILINYQRRYQILIDGGPSGKSVLKELAKVMPKFDRKIEVVISTHPDRDHFSGLIDVCKKYQVGVVLTNGQEIDDEVWRAFRWMLKEKNILTQTVGEGSRVNIGKDFGLKIYNPDKIELNKRAKNDNSIVSRLDYGGNSFLFVGDAGFDAEADMIFDQEDLDVDWLKVGHHGSKSATSKFFLSRVTPQVSIISVGENDYGHPTVETITRLKENNSKILRTDQQGTIKVVCPSKGEKCYVN